MEYLNRSLDERKALDMLLKKFAKKKNVVNFYRYQHGNNKTYIFDFVVLDDKDNSKISEIYEIKSRFAVRNNPLFIKNQLDSYEEITKAKVYLVYLSDSEKLEIIPVNNNIQQQDKPVRNEVTSFLGFYNKIKDICHNEGNYFFRGHSNYNYQAIPSIYRDNNIQNETRFYHEAIRKCPKDFTEDMSTFDKLVKMQHYELPTRLFDITTNPLIALFFACQGKENVDGEVLIYSMDRDQIKYYDDDSISILSNLAKCPPDFTFTEDKNDLVSYIKQDKPNFEEKTLEASDLENVFCVMPKLNNERIIHQHGAFFIFGMGKSKDAPAALLDDPRRIRIKSTAKKKILEELEMLGINEAELFPETDKIMNYIKRNI